MSETIAQLRSKALNGGKHATTFDRVCQALLIFWGGVGVVTLGIMLSAIYLGWPAVRHVPDSPAEIANRQQQERQAVAVRECAHLRAKAESAEQSAANLSAAMSMASRVVQVEDADYVQRKQVEAADTLMDWVRRCKFK